MNRKRPYEREEANEEEDEEPADDVRYVFFFVLAVSLLFSRLCWSFFFLSYNYSDSFTLFFVLVYIIVQSLVQGILIKPTNKGRRYLISVSLSRSVSSCIVEMRMIQ